MQSIPTELLKDIKSGKCIPFVGAGVTTEGHRKDEKFVDYIKKQCNYPKRRAQTFPEIMQHYCTYKNNGNKNKLINEIINWVEQYTGGDVHYRDATEFYHEIARVPFFKHFITTNWDPFCERELNVLVPMIEDRDIPFWDDAKRQVLKIHGCVTRPHTIIATRDDYDRCINEKYTGAIFTRLRDLMATRSFIFIGFSINDPDFKIIYDEVIQNLAEYRKGDWVIDSEPNPQTVDEWKNRGVRLIAMNAIAFAKELTNKLEINKIIPSKELIERFMEQRKSIGETHYKTCMKQDTAGGLDSSMYQDGILDEIEEIVTKTHLGATIEDFKTKLMEHNELLKGYRKKLEYYERKSKEKEIMYYIVEIAYLSGRAETLHRFLHN